MKQHANDLTGRDWTRFSISIWNDIRFTSEERGLKHPAMFPSLLVERLILCFTNSAQEVILDPFLGSGSTLVAAQRLGKRGIGFEVYPRFVELAKSRLGQQSLFDRPDDRPTIHHADARRISEFVDAESVDLCVTSPPYWDILQQKRTADNKSTRKYGDDAADLGTLRDYSEFLDEMNRVFKCVFDSLKPGRYCIVNVMDLRKKSTFFPLHSDISTKMREIGFIYDDLIIWDRKSEYNNLRPLGYPHVFRINKVHEFILVFKKPEKNEAATSTK